jgi:hypothetical protein
MEGIIFLAVLLVIASLVLNFKNSSNKFGSTQVTIIILTVVLVVLGIASRNEVQKQNADIIIDRMKEKGAL